MVNLDSETEGIIYAIGTVLIALVITGGFVGAVLTGQAVDGLSAGFLAVIGLFLGGGLVKGAISQATTKAAGVANIASQNATANTATVLNAPSIADGSSRPNVVPPNPQGNP